MTIEEAAEVILGGQAYETCSECGDLDSWIAKGLCDACNGAGKVVTERWRLACTALDKELPPVDFFLDELARATGLPKEYFKPAPLGWCASVLQEMGRKTGGSR